MGVNLLFLVIAVAVNTIFITPFIWLAGRALAGSRAKFTNAFWIVLLGTVICAFVGSYFSGPFGLAIELILWLALVSHFFDCGWLKALAISIVAVMIFAITTVILGLIGLSFFLL